MTLFEEAAQPAAETAPTRPQRSRRTIIGVSALVVALVAMLTMSFLPSGYVIQEPGPVVNTLGTVPVKDGGAVSLIDAAGEKTYPTAGTLSLTTVQVRGNRASTPSWIELATAWFDPSKAVLPIDAVYPPGVTDEQRNQQDQALMVDSQKEAAAAALTELGYKDVSHPVVTGFSEGTKADGPLKKDDVILAVDGVATIAVSQVRGAVAAKDGQPVTVTVQRGGEKTDVQVTPIKVQGSWLLGITAGMTYNLPVDIKIQLENIGGPSAGMMFTLGIIDVLTPGELNGGKDVAGTGTIDAGGVVGPIGGIRQKLYGAEESGAKYFIAPAANCNEVVGHIPVGLTVVSTTSLEDSMHILDVIASGSGIDKLPNCSAASPAP